MAMQEAKPESPRKVSPFTEMTTSFLKSVTPAMADRAVALAVASPLPQQFINVSNRSIYHKIQIPWENQIPWLNIDGYAREFYKFSSPTLWNSLIEQVSKERRGMRRVLQIEQTMGYTRGRKEQNGR